MLNEFRSIQRPGLAGQLHNVLPGAGGAMELWTKAIAGLNCFLSALQNLISNSFLSPALRPAPMPHGALFVAGSRKNRAWRQDSGSSRPNE
jgi:hypothetical protein